MILKPADLIFVKGTGFIDDEIEKISKSPYSHVAGVIERKELIEAQGFRKTGYQGLDFYTNFDVFTCDELTDEQREKIVDYVKSEVGSRYNYLLIGWELLRYSANIVVPLPMGHRVICSTLWSDAYKSVGVNLSPKIKYPAPGDLSLSDKLRKEK